MIRLTTALLSYENGKYFYQNQFFSGIGYHVVDATVEAIGIYEQGSCVADYANEYLPQPIQQFQIDSDYLEPENDDDYEPLMCYEGQRYSGMAYDFQNGFCTGELLYINGQLSSYVNYYTSGALEGMELIDGRILQRYYWHSNGVIKRFEVYDKNIFEITLGFEVTGEINCLSINGSYFNHIKQISDLLTLKEFSEKSFISSLKGSDYLFLQGSEITDEVFNQIIESHVLSKTSTLHISTTSITDDAIVKLMLLENIKKLRIDSPIISLASMKHIKSSNNDLHIELNGNDVEI